ncbi:MAG: sulfotransferase [Candidatus Binatia bacterium]
MDEKFLSGQARSRLELVKAGEGPINLRRFPDFLVVGPQRTGTTWLHANLRWHPEIFFTEPKEIFFFSRLKTPEDPDFRSNRLEWYLRCFYDPPWLLAYKHALALLKHGRFYRPLVRGEATASYAALDEDVIEEIVALKPEIRVIMMVRDPVARAWSHAKKDLVRNRHRRLEDVSDEEFRDFFSDEYQRSCARYSQNLDRWQAHLKPGHTLVEKFDDISSRPVDLLLEVMSFLGVSSEQRYVGQLASTTVNPTGSEAIPEQHRRFLEELLADEIAETRERFGVST